MGLWDDEDYYVVEEEENLYLRDADKGIQLVSKLLSYDKKKSNHRKTIQKLDYLLDRKLFERADNINLKNELELYEKLLYLSDKLYEQNRLQLLKNKTMIGIGGKFSAGKSKFINSVISSDLLPEDQNPTTSIATFIVSGEQEEVHAYTYNDQDILLDMEAAQALTHAFYSKYEIGFSQFINNMVINVSDFQYKNLAILDTPGYNKADSGVKQNATDAMKAFNQLKTVDYLIWLVDIENGVIQQADIDFIRSLRMKNPILIVFNKADKKPQSLVKSILDESTKILQNAGLNIYSVSAYSALYGEEFFGSTSLKDYMELANQSNSDSENIAKQLELIQFEIEKQLKLEKKQLLEKRNKIGEIIFRSQDVKELNTLVQIYTNILNEIKSIDHYSFEIEKTKNYIERLLASIG